VLLSFILPGILVAQDGAGDGGLGSMVWFLPYLVIFYLFYLIFIRPQRKEQNQRQMMLANMKKNDRVLTVGGIFGVVTNLDRDKNEITIRVDDSTNTKLRMALSSIARVLGDEPSKEGG